MPSQVPALIDYLVGKFQDAETLGQATPPVTVYDGPPTTSLDPHLKLYVGLTDPDSDAIAPAATFTQSRPDLGNTARDEVTVINCCAEAWSGDDTLSIQRHAVFGIVAAVENLIRADPALGGNGQPMPGVTAGDLLQNNTSTGAIARVPFTITIRSFT
jgi:hypothetical protein